MSTGWRGCKDTNKGPIVGGVKGQYGGGGIEDGEGVDLDLDVTGARLGTCQWGKRAAGSTDLAAVFLGALGYTTCDQYG